MLWLLAAFVVLALFFGGNMAIKSATLKRALRNAPKMGRKSYPKRSQGSPSCLVTKEVCEGSAARFYPSGVYPHHRATIKRTRTLKDGTIDIAHRPAVVVFRYLPEEKTGRMVLRPVEVEPVPVFYGNPKGPFLTA